MKFPPEQFYVDQLRRFVRLIGERPLYICIFTDDKDPAALLERFKTRVPGSTIMWDYSRNNKQDQRSILTDMLVLTHFDCLIRSQSNFPCVAELMTRHRIVMSLQKTQWSGNHLRVPETRIVFRDSSGKDLKRLTYEQAREDELKELADEALKDLVPKPR